MFKLISNGITSILLAAGNPRPGTVSDLARPGEGAPFDLCQFMIQDNKQRDTK